MTYFLGKKISKKAVPPREENLKLFRELESGKFTTSYEFINQINNVQNSWKAVVYEGYSSMTVAQLISRAGGPKRFDFPPTRSVTIQL